MVVPNLIYRLSPEYQMAYEEGFNDGRDFVVNKLLPIIKEVAKTKAFSETSATMEVK